jgi:oligosaccharide reducing-end xylanase
MPMGTSYDYQIMESEGYHSSGSSNITVSECTSCATTAPTATTSYDYEVGATATQLTATGTALKWYTVETGGTASGTAPTPSTTAAGTTKYYVSQTLNGCEGPRTEITVKVSIRYKIYKVSTPIVVDGTPEAAWTNASVLSAAATKLLTGTVSNSADLSGNFKALWDDTYLYVLADVSDDIKVNESANVYDDDAVEVYVDINNNKATTYGANDVQYSFGWNDGTTIVTLPTGRSTTGITYAAVARTGGYVVETRIPWSTLQGTPTIGQLVGMDFMINDDDDNSTRDGKLSWNASTDNAWENPSLFGTAVLQGALPCTTPAAPSVVTPITYCQNATSAALTATGTSLLWYTASSGGTGSATAPTPSTSTAGTINYFVTQNVGGCESSRSQIAVTVNALPSAPSVSSPVTYCQNATATALTASGNALKWYTVLTGGTALGSAPSPSTGSTGTTNYYVSQTTNSCEGPRATIAVTVNGLPSAPTVSSPVTYCQNATATALTATGTTLKWYTVLTGGTALGSVPTPATGSAGTTNYFVSQTISGCEGPRATIAVTVNSLPSAPSVTSPVTYCQNATATALTATGTALKWYTGSTGGTGSATAPTPSTTAVGTTNNFVSQTLNGCESERATLAVTVNASPAAPTVSSPVSYCQNATATALTATGTSLSWYTGTTGGTGSATAPTPVTTSTGTTNHYVSQTISGCESARSTIAVTVNALPAAPLVSSPVAYCQNATANALTATGTALKWYTGSTGGTGSATAPTPSTSTIGTINYYVSQTTNSCEGARATIAVTINSAATASISTGGSTKF